MKIAVSSVCWMCDDMETAIEKASNCGFKALELLTFPKEIFPLHGDLLTMKPSYLRERLNRSGMELIALHLGQIYTSTEERRRVLTDYAKRAIEYAMEMSCNLIVESGPMRNSEPLRPFFQSLEDLLLLLEGTNIKIALENHYLNWIQFAQDYEHIFDYIDSPNLGITLDTGHFHLAGVDPQYIVEKFTNKVLHVHIKDIHGTEGVNNIGTVRALKNIGYTGYLSQEIEISNKEEADKAAFEGYAYMQKLGDDF